MIFFYLLNSSFASFAPHALKGQKLIKQHALKGQKLLAQGSALGCYGRIADCHYTQGVALG